MILNAFSRKYDIATPTATQTKMFTLEIKNPCVDPTLTQIKIGNPATMPQPANALTERNYIIFDVA